MRAVSEEIPVGQVLAVDAGLLLVAIAWGASYSLMQLIVSSGVAVPVFLMLRFATAVPFIAVGAGQSVRSLNREEVINGVLFGALLYAILTFETLGVKHTTAANAGFLIAISVVLVPLYERIFGGRHQSWLVYAAALASLVGCGLLTLSTSAKISINAGDALIMAAAMVRSFQIFLFGKQTAGRKVSIVNITLVELVVVAALGLLGALFTSPADLRVIPEIPLRTWAYIVFLGIFATAFAFLMQLHAAKLTSPTRVGMILSLEPAFAAVCAMTIMGEHVSVLQLIGGCIIVLAALVGRSVEARQNA